MKIMYIITLLSFAVLAGAIFAIVRHIRKGAAAPPSDKAEAASSQALEARLSGLSRIRSTAPVSPAATPADPQDFSYFGKDRKGQVPPAEERRSDAPHPIRRPTADQS